MRMKIGKLPAGSRYVESEPLKAITVTYRLIEIKLIPFLSLLTAFVKSERPGKFPNLEVKYMGGQMPQIR